MLGFAGIALAELKTQVPAAEQFGDDVVGVALLAAALTVGSIFPKFVSGSSLKVSRARAPAATADTAAAAHAQLRAQHGTESPLR